MGSFGIIKNGKKQIITSGGGGHKILNRIKIALTQRPALWFKDAHITDDAENDSTDVEIIKDITSAQFTALVTDGSTEGAYNITDEDAIPTDAEYIGYDNTTSGMSANNVQDAIDEVVADIALSNSSVSFDSPWQRWTTNKLSKFNRIVIANVSFYPSSAVTAGVQTQIGTVPSGYRPSYTVRTSSSDGCDLAIAYTGAILYTPKNAIPYASFSVVYTV